MDVNVGNLVQVQIAGGYQDDYEAVVTTKKGIFSVDGTPNGAIGQPVYLSADGKTLWITKMDNRYVSGYSVK